MRALRLQVLQRVTARFCCQRQKVKVAVLQEQFGIISNNFPNVCGFMCWPVYPRVGHYDSSGVRNIWVSVFFRCLCCVRDKLTKLSNWKKGRSDEIGVFCSWKIQFRPWCPTETSWKLCKCLSFCSKHSDWHMLWPVHFFPLFRPFCEHCIKASSKVILSSSSKHVASKSLVVPVRTYSQVLALRQSQQSVRNLLRLREGCRHFSSMQSVRRPLTARTSADRFFIFGGTFKKHMSTSRIVGTVSRFLRLRYLVLTSAVGGGITLNKVRCEIPVLTGTLFFDTRQLSLIHTNSRAHFEKMFFFPDLWIVEGTRTRPWMGERVHSGFWKFATIGISNEAFEGQTWNSIIWFLRKGEYLASLLNNFAEKFVNIAVEKCVRATFREKPVFRFRRLRK